jgi:predicted RNA binding protein YcfA (HicA-like mRNA interferase family)
MIRRGIQNADHSRDIIRRLQKEGWTLERVTGSHHVFKSPVSGETVVVPHPKKKDLGKGLSMPFIRSLAGGQTEAWHDPLYWHR